jgi:hypothetical protein
MGQINFSFAPTAPILPEDPKQWNPSLQQWISGITSVLQELLNGVGNPAAVILSVESSVSGSPLRLTIPLNAAKDKKNAWYQVDFSKPSWLLTLDVSGNFVKLEHSVLGATYPITWVTLVAVTPTSLTLFGLKYPVVDGTPGQKLTTDGAGNLSWT